MSQPTWRIAYLCLGSNVGDKQKNLQQAACLLRSPSLRLVQASTIYKSSPVDYLDQDWFLNQVLVVETTFSPEALLAHCLHVEERMGRQRTVDKGPRCIDVDLLLYGLEIINSPDLTVPHPRMAERKFVLVPLAEVAPGYLHPVLKKSILQLLQDRAGDPAWVVPA